METETPQAPQPERKEKPGRTDIIFILTNIGATEKTSRRTEMAGSELSYRAKMRAMAAHQMAREQIEAGYECPLIVIVGGLMKGSPFSESRLMANFLAVRYKKPRRGWFQRIPEDKIITLQEYPDQEGKPADIKDTGTSMRAIFQHLEGQKEGQNMAIVSNATHLRRIRSIARQLGIEHLETVAAEKTLKSAEEKRGGRKIRPLIARFQWSALPERVYEWFLTALSEVAGERYLRASQITSKARGEKTS